MRQLLEFFLFELKVRFKSISTYVYFGIWFFFSFLCVASENFGPIAFGNGKVLLNGPYANSYNDIYASFFGIIIVAAIFGTSILRDFQRDTTQIIFTKPISKFAYLGGRWLGSLVTTAIVFFGLIPGEMLGALAPWADHTRIAHAPLSWYFQPFFSIVVVQIFFLGSLFFLVAALSRRVFIVYLQGAAVLALYLFYAGAFLSTRSLNRFWPGIFDPVGILLSDGLTRYWTVVDKNRLLFSWSPHVAQGLFLYNRLVWCGFGALTLVVLWVLFPMSLEALTARASSRRAKIVMEQDEDLRPVRSFIVTRTPLVHQIFGPATTWAQYLSLTRMRLRNVVRDIPFWVLLILMAGLSCSNGRYAGKLGGENVWPVTYLMLQAVEGIAILFFFIIATFYAAELIWRERDTHFEGIHDALPIGETTDWLSKLTALCFVEFAVLAVAGLCGMFMQAIQGYYHFELLQYFKELYVVTFPQILVFALLAMFVQTVVSNKFLGHGIVVAVFVLQPILFNFGWENTLYLFGATPPYTYSDMNGYGHFVLPLFWSITYWLSIAAFLGVLSIGLARRGAEDSLGARLRSFRQNFRHIAAALAVCLLSPSAVASGTTTTPTSSTNISPPKTVATSRRSTRRISRSTSTFRSPKSSPSTLTSTSTPSAAPFPAPATSCCRTRRREPIAAIHITNAQQGCQPRELRPAVPSWFPRARALCTRSMRSTSLLRPARP